MTNATMTKRPDVFSAATGREVQTSQRSPARVDLEAERAVLAGILLDGEESARTGVFKRVSVMLTADDFFAPQHATLWTAFSRVMERGGNLDVITATAEVRAMGAANAVGGAQGIAELVDYVPTAAHCESHALIVAEHAAARRFGTLLANAARRIAAGSPLGPLHAEVLTGVRAVRLPGVRFASMSEVVDEAVATICARLEGRDIEQVLSSSLPEVNEALAGGWRVGLNLLGARPNIGKTMLLTQEVIHVARTQGPVFYLTLEARKHQIVEAMVANISGIPLDYVKNPQRMNQTEVDAVFRAFNEVNGLPITICDMVTSGCPYTVPQIEAALLSLPVPPVFVAIDHVRKLKPAGKHAEMRFALGEIAAGLHEIGLSRGIAVNAIIHVGRDAVKGTISRIPGMADLKESGELEEVADSIVIMHCEGKYPTKKYGEGEEPSKDIVEIIVPKLRNAPAGGRVAIRMHGATQRFHSLQTEDQVFHPVVEAPVARGRKEQPIVEATSWYETVGELPGADGDLFAGLQ